MSEPEEKKSRILPFGICRWHFCLAVILSTLLGVGILSTGGPGDKTWSMILLVLTGWGFFGCLIGGVCAFINFLSDRKNPARWAREFFSFGGVLVVWFFLVSMASPGCTVRPRARLMSCTANLKQISLALEQYAGDYDGHYPPENGAAGLERLRSTGILTDYYIYICPASATRLPKPAGSLTEATCDYIYYGGHKAGDKNAIIAMDKPVNHDKGYVVLFAEGHVETTYE